MLEITTDFQFEKLKDQLMHILMMQGKKVGDTFEGRAEFPELMIGPKDLDSMIDQLGRLVPDEVKEREAEEYSALIKQAMDVCANEFDRDPLGRRAVVIHPGCITYQHFFLRRGSLSHVVHMRGMDIRKLHSDLQLFLRTEKAILDTLGSPDIHLVRLKVTVDCFHFYTRPGVPL